MNQVRERWKVHRNEWPMASSAYLLGSSRNHMGDWFCFRPRSETAVLWIRGHIRASISSLCVDAAPELTQLPRQDCAISTPAKIQHRQ